MGPFYINNRYFIDPSSNSLKVEATGKKRKMEPRIMEVLCMLAAKPGQTISREEMVSTIWKDYGGGDEGLTQAISTLRKLLSDQDKELVQTIPKKGYCMNAEISFRIDDSYWPTKTKPPSGTVKKSHIVMVLALPVVAATLYLFSPLAKEGNLVFTRTQPAIINFPGLNPELDPSLENEKNTIITIGPDSTVYKLVMVGDAPPHFYINGKNIPVHEWEPHQGLINDLRTQLRKKQ